MKSETRSVAQAPFKDCYGSSLSTDEMRAKLVDQLNHLESVKLKAIEMGHQDMATSVSKQQREIRESLNSI